MLTKRVIPCLDIKEGRVVKGTKFLNLRDAGDPPSVAEAYGLEGADELVFLDITASHERRQILLDVVRRTTERVFVPFTVGGGIRTLDEIKEILRAGADKVSLNTSAIERPAFVREAADRFGCQCIVVAIDAKRRSVAPTGGTLDFGLGTLDPRHKKPECSWEAFTHGGRTPTGRDAIDWAREAASLGAGEILLTSMDCDGTKDGYDIPLTRAVSEGVRIPVIASGGAGEPRHLFEALTDGCADAALAASIFHDRIHPVAEVKAYLAERGVPIRPCPRP